MNRSIRRVGAVVIALFAALFLELNYLQVLAGPRLAEDSRNIRRVLRDFTRPRGRILSADGEVVARSVPSDDELEYQRLYPQGALFGHLSGFFSFVYGASGIEEAYHEALSGRRPTGGNFGDLLAGSGTAADVVLSVSVEAQRAAKEALGGQRGSVVALNPKTGAILVLYSEPSYDPSPLAGHRSSEVQTAYAGLESDPTNPMLARAFRERYPPGSTFKTVTASIALAEGSTPSTQFPTISALALPQTDKVLSNFGGRSCGGTLAESFRVSCNTTFAALGLSVGERLALGAQAFGIGQRIPFDLPTVASLGPEPGTFAADQPSFAYAAIGQGDVAVTPLQMALVAAAVANDGKIMVPRLVQEIRGPGEAKGRTVPPRLWRSAIDLGIAAEVRAMMVDVVARGTGRAARLANLEVAGKTGTAEAPGGSPHAWFIGFAPASDPVVAIAVLVERGGDLGDEATGGRVAAPIAGRLLGRLVELARAGVRFGAGGQ